MEATFAQEAAPPVSGSLKARIDAMAAMPSVKTTDLPLRADLNGSAVVHHGAQLGQKPQPLHLPVPHHAVSIQ